MVLLLYLYLDFRFVHFLRLPAKVELFGGYFGDVRLLGFCGIDAAGVLAFLRQTCLLTERIVCLALKVNLLC